MSLYNEAIADAKELVRMAEENATNKLVETVAPRIRKLVERNLLENSFQNEDEDIDAIVASLEDTDVDDSDEDTSDIDTSDDFDDDSSDDDLENLSGNDDEGMSFQDASGDGNSLAQLPLKGVKKINIEFEGENKQLNSEGVTLSKDSIATLLSIIDGNGSLKDRIHESRIGLKSLGREVGSLNEGRTNSSAALRIVEKFNRLVKKSISLKNELNELPAGKLKEASTKEFELLLKEIKEMSTKRLLRTLLENEDKRSRLREADEADEADTEEEDDDSEESEDTDDSGDESDAGGDMDIDAVKAAISQLASAVGMQVSSGDDDSGDDLEFDLDDDGDDDEGSDDEGDDDLDVKDEMDEMDEMDMEDEGMGMEGMDMEGYGMEGDMDETVYEMDADEGDMHEGDDMDEADDMDEVDESLTYMESRRRKGGVVFNIDESILRKELTRLRRIREEADPTTSFGGDPENKFKSYDSVKLNANVPENEKVKKEGKKPAPKKGKDLDEADKADKSDKAKKEAVKESRRNRELEGRLKESVAAVTKLSKQLAEQKLFNAKLLYVTKLLQSQSLSRKKLEAVVEAFDSTRTLREANLLFNSLNEALAKGDNKLTEGTNRTVGNSSRSTRPGGLVNESVEVNRWAVLAGIGNDKA